MLLTLTTTRRPATDLGYLLVKHPDKVHAFSVPTGTAYVLYPEAAEDRCTAALVLDVDPSLLRTRADAFSLGQYVNDRPYAASSLLAGALSRVFRSALRGTSKDRPELAGTAIPLEIRVPVLRCRDGHELAERLFAPLGWAVTATPIPLEDGAPDGHPLAGDSPYVDLTLTGELRVADALNHLYVLLPVLDDAKHYWVAPDEIEKLLRSGAGWLAGHPERVLIIRRYLAHRRSLAASALEQLDGDDPDTVDRTPDTATDEDAELPVVRKQSLAEQRRDAVFAGAGDAIWTRTGRAFFDSARTVPLLDRLRAAARPLFDELDTEWLLIDSELLPWSAKAGGLIRERYAAVGAAGRAAVPAALAVLDRAAGRGLDVAGLRDRIELRASEIAGYSAAYRQYVGPSESLTLAPFAVLAGAGVSYAGRDHGWHLALADRLVAADPDLFTPTRRMVVELADPASEAAATDWWRTLTEAGGEGMVVKPWSGLTATDARGRLVQPGVKCRGREYLRIIYGPEYTRPDLLTGLRHRRLGRKRGLALIEHGLGLAALDRLASGAPTWRIHELVFAILAFESEPVDPRL